MKLVAETGHGPKDQIASIGCSIKWGCNEPAISTTGMADQRIRESQAGMLACGFQREDQAAGGGITKEVSSYDYATITLNCTSALRLPYPAFRNSHKIQRHIFMVPIHQVPRDFPYYPNARLEHAQARVSRG